MTLAAGWQTNGVEVLVIRGLWSLSKAAMVEAWARVEQRHGDR